MLSINMYVCETQEEAASVVQQLSSSVEPGEVLMQAISDQSVAHLICAMTPGTFTGNVNDAISTSLVMLLSTALDSFNDSGPNSWMN